MLYLLKLAVTLRLCCDPQQLLLMFLDLFLEAHVLLTHHSLQFLQLKTKTQHIIQSRENKNHYLLTEWQNQRRSSVTSSACAASFS